MARLNSIKCLNNINSQKTHELLVLGMFKDSKPDFKTACSKDLSNSINEKIELDNFEGKENKMLSCYGDKNIKRWLVVGFGDKKSSSLDNFRAVGANIVSYANKNNLKIINKRTSSIISFNLPKDFNLESLKNLLNGQKLVKDIFKNNKDASDLFIFLIENSLIDFSFHPFFIINK